MFVVCCGVVVCFFLVRHRWVRPLHKPLFVCDYFLSLLFLVVVACCWGWWWWMEVLQRQRSQGAPRSLHRKSKTTPDFQWTCGGLVVFLLLLLAFVDVRRPSQILAGHSSSCCPQQVVSAVMRRNGEEDIISRTTAQKSQTQGEKLLLSRVHKRWWPKALPPLGRGDRGEWWSRAKFNAALNNVPSARVGRNHPAFNVIRRPSSLWTYYE